MNKTGHHKGHQPFSCIQHQISKRTHTEKPVSKPKINTGDLVLVQDHTTRSFQPRLKEDFRVINIKGNSIEVKNNHGFLSTFHITDVTKTAMVEKVKELLPDFKKFGRKGKLCMDPDLFKDLGWTLDQDPPNLIKFRDNSNIDSACTQDSVNNTVKSVTPTKILANQNIQVHSLNIKMSKSPQRTKLRRSQRLKTNINSPTKSIKKALKGKGHK